MTVPACHFPRPDIPWVGPKCASLSQPLRGSSSGGKKRPYSEEGGRLARGKDPSADGDCLERRFEPEGDGEEGAMKDGWVARTQRDGEGAVQEGKAWRRRSGDGVCVGHRGTKLLDAVTTRRHLCWLAPSPSQ